MAKKIAFCGLGRMGAPMAARVLDAGNDLVVWNRTRSKTAGLKARGARVAATPAEAARGTDAVITMLAAPEPLMEVVFGEDGLASALSEGGTLIEMSTVGPSTVGDLRARLPHVDVLDAPVLGSVVPATRGELTVIVGADAAIFERWREFLAVFGSVFRVGGPGAGAALKLIVNGTLLVAMAELGEALAVGERFGLERNTVLDILERGYFGPIAKYKRADIERGSFEPAFPLKHARKDLELITQEAAQAGADTELARAALTAWRSAEAAGLGDLDYSAIVRHLTAREEPMGE